MSLPHPQLSCYHAYTMSPCPHGHVMQCSLWILVNTSWPAVSLVQQPKGEELERHQNRWQQLPFCDLCQHWFLRNFLWTGFYRSGFEACAISLLSHKLINTEIYIFGSLRKRASGHKEYIRESTIWIRAMLICSYNFPNPWLHLDIAT